MLTKLKLNKSRPMRWVSLFLGLILVGAFNIPLAPSVAWGANSELQSTKVSDSNLLQADKAKVVTEPSLSNSSATDFAGGTGTEQDPYLVATEAQLNNVRNYLDKYFKQTANITLNVVIWNQGQGWEPIGAEGEGTEFVGQYNGNGFSIYKLYSNRPAQDNIGLFGMLGTAAKLSNITLESVMVIGNDNVGGLAGNIAAAAEAMISNCHVTTGTVQGKGDDTGGLLGWNQSGEISNCYSKATISGGDSTGGLVGANQGIITHCYTTTGSVVGGDPVGGLVGYNGSSVKASISYSYSSSKVTGNDSVGGLVGHNEAGTIFDCQASGTVNAADRCAIGGLIGLNSGNVAGSYARGNVECTSFSSAGGLVGYNTGASLLSECYASGTVTAVGSSTAGGLIGRNGHDGGVSVSDCYAVGKVSGSTSGGLIGSRSYDYSVIYSAYYDKSTTGQSDTDKGGIPKTTAEMKQQATFEGWDFVNTWTIKAGTSYPDFQWNNRGNVAFSVATYSVSEAGPTAKITVKRSNGSCGAVGVTYATSNGTAKARSDYTAKTGTLAFAAGEVTKTFTIPITDDTSVESNETVILKLSNPTDGATLGTLSQATLTIVDNDTLVAYGKLQFSAATYSVSEAGSTAAITVSRVNGSSGAVGVTYATSNGTATAGSDYTTKTGTLAFAAGEVTKTFTIPITNDTSVESNETVILKLSNPTGGATLGTPSQATLTIVDNDTPVAYGKLQFSAATYSVSEAGSTATITVSRVNGSSKAVGVTYATSNGTATAGSDYTTKTGMLAFAAGEVTKTFTIPITNDTSVESNETVILKLSNPTGGATLGTPSQATLTIVDNDGATDPYEPNNTLATAYGPISSGASYKGYISTGADQDWFKLITKVAGTISIGLTNLPGDYDIGLYNASKVLLASSKKTGKNAELLTVTAAPIGTYYIGVFGWGGNYNTTQPYTLKATF